MTASQPQPSNFGFASGVWLRFVGWVRSWFEIPYGYEDEKGFHYGKQTPPEWFQPTASETSVFTDRASQAMKYSHAMPEETTVEAPAKVASASAS